LEVAQGLYERAFADPNSSEHVRDMSLMVLAFMYAGRMEVKEAFDTVSTMQNPGMKQYAIHLVTNGIQGSREKEQTLYVWNKRK
jgi:hypothetical protein